MSICEGRKHKIRLLKALTVPDSYGPHSDRLDLLYIGIFIINSQAR
jgi:hypothetical protein